MTLPKNKEKLEQYIQKQREIALEKGFGKWMKGRKLSKKTREKIGLALRGRVINSVYKQCEYCKKDFHCYISDKRRYCSRKCYLESPIRKQEYGKRNREYWEDKPKKYTDRPYHGSDYRYDEWRNAVFERDKYTCQKCEARGYIEAHHIKSWKNYPKLRYKISNGITLCKQ